MTDRPLLDHLAAFFSDEDWEFERNDDTGILHLTYRAERLEFDVYVQALEDEAQSLVLSVAPFLVPEDRRMATSELATRANFGLPIGNFELDMDSGELRYKTSIESSADQLTNEHVLALTGANLAVMSHYLAGFRAVVFAEASPAAIVRELNV